MIFPKDDMIELLDLSVNESMTTPNGEYTAITAHKMHDKSRWSIHYSYVFKFNDNYYKTHYSVGATESQDEGPYEYDNEVTCEQVFPKYKVTLVYE